MNKINLTIVLCLLLLVSACKPENETPIKEQVKTENGLVKGTFVEESGITIFKGVPFAAPPVGDLRWKAPQPTESWEGVKECTKFSASAIQATPVPFLMWTQEFIAPKEPISEDCLYLNVWTGATNPGENRPVFVFVHGGGFSSGSGSVPIYDGEEMAKKGIVFITINYRVGILGFLAHPELTAEADYNASGNYGLLDQVEALKWVNKNITAFGGDPNNVTIAGQSAGAFSINYLVASPLTNGLIHRAIAESGGAIVNTNRLSRGKNLEMAEEDGVKWTESLGANSIAELRSKSADEILAAGGSASPIVDGYMIPEPMMDIFSQGKQNDVPLILGWNENEGNFGGPLQSAEDFKVTLKEKFGDDAVKFLEIFPFSNDEEAMAIQTKLSGLEFFGVQMYKWMLLQNEKATSKVYMYHFERELPYAEGMQPFGAFHTGEVPYAYNNLHTSPRPWEEIDYKLAETMSDYWANFAKTGNPNGEGLPEWSQCTPDNTKVMILGDEVSCEDLPDSKILDFLESYYCK